MPEPTRAQAPAWLTRFNRGDLAACEALCSPALVLHFADPLLKASAPGLAGWMQVLGILRAGFPNLKLQLQNEAGQSPRTSPGSKEPETWRSANHC